MSRPSNSSPTSHHSLHPLLRPLVWLLDHAAALLGARMHSSAAIILLLVPSGSGMGLQLGFRSLRQLGSLIRVHHLPPRQLQQKPSAAVLSRPRLAQHRARMPPPLRRAGSLRPMRRTQCAERRLMQLSSVLAAYQKCSNQ